jgi:hypothetical protein
MLSVCIGVFRKLFNEKTKQLVLKLKISTFLGRRVPDPALLLLMWKKTAI